MILNLKPITLKNDTIQQINNGIIDTTKFVDYIKKNVMYSNNIIETKLLSLDEDELYEMLSKIFEIEFDESDLFKILRNKYNKHYINKLTLKTNLVDIDLNKITLVGAATKNVLLSNTAVPITELRNIVNSYDFIVLKTVKTKLKEKPDNYDKFEKFTFETASLDDDSDIFEYKKELLKKDIKDKKVLTTILDLTKKYLSELISQAKTITRLGEENESLKPISLEYKKAYETNFSKSKVFVKGEHKRRY